MGTRSWCRWRRWSCWLSQGGRRSSNARHCLTRHVARCACRRRKCTLPGWWEAGPAFRYLYHHKRGRPAFAVFKGWGFRLSAPRCLCFNFLVSTSLNLDRFTTAEISCGTRWKYPPFENREGRGILSWGDSICESLGQAPNGKGGGDAPDCMRSWSPHC